MAEFNDKETMPLEEVVQTPEILEELEVESVCYVNGSSCHGLGQFVLTR